MKNEFEKRILSSLVIVPIALFFVIKGSIFFIFFLGTLFLTISYEWIKMNKIKMIKILGIVYLIFALYLTYLMRKNFGLDIFILVMIICIFTDIGGYTFGKIFKGPKLTKISPNKTYSGLIGSFILSIIAAIAFIEYQKINLIYWNFLDLVRNDFIYILFILLISAISQIGDLIISFFKRLAKVKNTGKFLPGHGGLLDRLDGIIFALPASYILLNFLNS